MRRRFQFVASTVRVSSRTLNSVAALLLMTSVFACPAAVQAQGAVLPVIGHVEGNDISCESGTPETGQYSTVGTKLDVSDGTVVTVHSGQALMTLISGGQVGICGPAKLTVLLSGNAITLALNFGRVRVELPAKSDLRIFTPTLIGTPLDISGGARDVTVGLSLDDSLCVTATSGAIQLEHQFTGEKMIVPQAGEFFLNAGKLVAVAGTPGSCKCTATGATTSPAPQPEFATAAPSTPPAIPSIPPAAMSAPNSGSASAPAAVETTAPPAAERPVEYAQLSEANETHPVSRSPKERPAPPPSSNATYTAVLPPLTFSAGSPAPPPAAAADQVLLVREAHVSPSWEFSGHVEPPAFAKAMSHALGEGAAPAKKAPARQPPAAGAMSATESSPSQPAAENQSASAAAEPAPEAQKRHGGFWASLKRVFGAS
jgi:hypothetical protein